MVGTGFRAFAGMLCPGPRGSVVAPLSCTPFTLSIVLGEGLGTRFLGRTMGSIFLGRRIGGNGPPFGVRPGVWPAGDALIFEGETGGQAVCMACSAEPLIVETDYACIVTE